jgi:DNA-binding FadR family transcriptional regulator
VILRDSVLPVSTALFQLRPLITDRVLANIERSQAGHEAIWQAIEAGEAKHARSSMLSHIGQFEQELRASNLFARQDATQPIDLTAAS